MVHPLYLVEYQIQLNVAQGMAQHNYTDLLSLQRHLCGCIRGCLVHLKPSAFQDFSAQLHKVFVISYQQNGVGRSHINTPAQTNTCRVSVQ
jgi:hypothetical protein